MEHFKPYLIRHIYINKGEILSKINIGKQGYYLVFWWREIPLGHLFLSPDIEVSENQFFIKLAECLEPALRFYARRQGLILDINILELLLNNEVKKWQECMENIFSGWLQETVPPKVPVTVIICTRNRASSLNKCLVMLQQLQCLPEEIIVVDNASEDDSTYKVVQQYQGISYIKEPRPGLDIARNTGIKNANCPIVAYVDDDVIVHPLWIYRVYESFENPKVAAMTGLVIAAELETEAQWIFERCWSFNRGYTDKLYNENYIKGTLATGPPVWEIGAGANMAFRKSVFSEVGFFDELLDVGAAGCSGDSEMWFRTLINGFEISYNPRAVVYHSHRKEMTGLKKQIFSYMRGHTVAALLQQQQHQNAGYYGHIFNRLPRKYLRTAIRTLMRDFPYTKKKDTTLWMEIKGLLSGLVYYYQNRKNSSR